MRIKVTAGELSVMGQPLLDLLNTEMPGGIGYRVARLGKQLAGEIDVVEKAKIAIIQKHGGTQNEIMMSWSLEPDNERYPEAIDELNRMLIEEIEVDIDPVILPPQVQLKPHILLILEKFISVAEK